jgi:ribose 5-phosphate isomerase B
MAANLVSGVRAALVWNVETATLARSHNDANVVSIGVRQHALDEVLYLIEAFLAEPFSGSARHQRRIQSMSGYEHRQVSHRSTPPADGAVVTP